MSDQKHVRYVLHALHIDNFGAFHQKDVGPFGPGLNVVYGKNEAGKTTIRKFIAGVLFGWLQGGANRNSYTTSGDREGTLSFLPSSAGEDADGSYASEIRIHRTTARDQSNEVAQGSGLLDDIDKTTYGNVFSLDTDELMDLKSGDKLTSRFLSASADTSVSPSQAKAQIEAQIKDCFSRAQGDEHKDSIPHIKERLSQVQERLEAAEGTRHDIFDARTMYKNLEHHESELDEHIANIESRVERLQKCQIDLDSWKNSQKDLDEEARSLSDREDELQRERRAFERSYASIPQKSADDVVRLRSELKSLERRITRSEDALHDAKSHRDDSFVSLQTMKNKIEKEQSDSVSSRTSRAARRMLPSVLAVVLVAIGAMTFSFGRVQSSISITGLGICILGIAFAGIIVLFVSSRSKDERPNRLSVLESQLDSAQLVFDRDDALLKTKRANFDAAHDEATRWIVDSGLGSGSSSLDDASRMLDSIDAVHERQRQFAQSQQSLDVQDSQIEKRQRALDEDHRSILHMFEDADIDNEAPDLEQKLAYALRAASEELKSARDDRNQTARTIGQLNERLSGAVNDNELNELRLQKQKLQTKLDDARRHLAVLLLARDLISSALRKWESQSSPDVYERAGHLLKTMTAGAWDHVQVDDGGKIQAVSFSGNAVKPVRLSLGTRQQLYLALRLALLQTASDVGRNVPVLCDDILVNFDEVRRDGAARAIAELAEQRQVIVFTCHEDVVSLLSDVCPYATVLSL